VIRVYDASGNVIETHEHTGDFKEPYRYKPKSSRLEKILSRRHFVMEPQMTQMNADTLRRQLHVRLSAQSAVLPQGSSAERLPRKLSGFSAKLGKFKVEKSRRRGSNSNSLIAR
jgi:hypothetical protein